MFSGILPACTTSEIPLLSHSVLFLFLWSTLIVALSTGELHVPPLNADDDVNQSLSRGEIAVEGNLEQLGGPTAFPLPNEQMASVNFSIVGWTPSGVFTGHWSRYLDMCGSKLR